MAICWERVVPLAFIYSIVCLSERNVKRNKTMEYSNIFSGDFVREFSRYLFGTQMHYRLCIPMKILGISVAIIFDISPGDK